MKKKVCVLPWAQQIQHAPFCCFVCPWKCDSVYKALTFLRVLFVIRTPLIKGLLTIDTLYYTLLS